MVGIYSIKNGEFAYVGLSNCIEKRLASHKSLIVKGVHPNFKGFSKDLSSYSFSVIELCNESELCAKEKIHFDKLSKSYKMVNIRECGIQGTRISPCIDKATADRIKLGINGDSFFV